MFKVSWELGRSNQKVFVAIDIALIDSYTYQFREARLGLLENGLRPLIHGLLLLFQHLRVLALLQALEDLPG